MHLIYSHSQIFWNGRTRTASVFQTYGNELSYIQETANKAYPFSLDCFIVIAFCEHVFLWV